MGHHNDGDPWLQQRHRADRPTTLATEDNKEFRFGFGNAVSQEESDALFDAWTIPSPARPLFQAAAANFVMHSQAAVDTRNESRGHSLTIDGGWKDVATAVLDWLKAHGH